MSAFPVPYRAFLLALLSAALSACGLTDNTPTYRYRLTVEVDTPEGAKSGSSVIEVETELGGEDSIPSPGRVTHRVRGEAVAVDLGERGVLFALLRSDNDIDWASRVMFLLAPGYAGEDAFQLRYGAMMRDRRLKTLPRKWPRMGHLDPRSAYPMLVTFGDVSDPSSVEEVDPDDLAATFGDGVSLKRITVQMTNDAVTSGIDKRLRLLTDSAISRWRDLPLDTRRTLIGLWAGKVEAEP